MLTDQYNRVLCSRMEGLIASLLSPLNLPHCITAILSAGVALSMVILDGLVFREVSEESILLEESATEAAGVFTIPGTSGNAVRFHTRDVVELSSHRKVTSFPEQAGASTILRVTEGDKRQYRMYLNKIKLYTA